MISRTCRHPGPADMERQLVHTDNLEKEGLQEMTPDEDRLVQTRKKKKKKAGNTQKTSNEDQFRTDHQAIFKVS